MVKRTRTSQSSQRTQRSQYKKPRRQTKRASARSKKFIKSVALSLAETKMKVIPFSNLSMTTQTFSAYDLNSMSQGDLGSSRDGNQIICRGFHLKGYLFNRSFLEPVLVRMMILKSKKIVRGSFRGRVWM